MALEYKIIPEKSLVIERCKGRTTAPEIKQFMQTIWADHAYQKSFDGIVDFSDAELDMKPEDVAAISEFILTSPEASEGRYVFIVSKPVETALCFLLRSGLAKKHEAVVFNCWESVHDFLGVPFAFRSQLAGQA